METSVFQNFWSKLKIFNAEKGKLLTLMHFLTPVNNRKHTKKKALIEICKHISVNIKIVVYWPIYDIEYWPIYENFHFLRDIWNFYFEKYPNLTIWPQERNIPRCSSPWAPQLVDVKFNCGSFEVLIVHVTYPDLYIALYRQNLIRTLPEAKKNLNATQICWILWCKKN